MSTLTAKSPQGEELNLDESVVNTFRAQVRGPILVKGDPQYDQACNIWNAMITRRPAMIVHCLDSTDIMAGVNFARAHGIALSVRGGGHNISGMALSDGGMVLDMSLRKGVWVDPASRRAIAQTGCTLGDVDRETQLHGLATSLGFISKTGIAGLTLGGGFGYLTRRFGWTCDSVRSLEVVTADGRLVRASEKENPDLFWAMRGGGSNFGIATNIEYSLYPVGPEILGGAIAWPGEDAPRVLEAFGNLLKNAPSELTCAAALRPAPPAPWLKKESHGKPIAILVLCYTGPLEKGEKLLAPLKSLGSPVGDLLQRRTYVSQQSLLDGTQPDGRRNYWKSEYVASHGSELSARLIDSARRIVSPHSTAMIFQLEGALNRLPADYSAVGNRDAHYVINLAASWEKAKDDEANIAWARNSWRDMKQFSTGGTYVNFLTEEEGDDRVRSAYGDNYARLADIKKRWDPANFFRANKNVVPA